MWLVLPKLLAMFIVVGIGWWAGRKRWLGEGDTARVLGNAAFMVFVPALLFRTAARLDLAALLRRTLAAFFVPALLTMLGVYLVFRLRDSRAVSLRKKTRGRDLWISAPRRLRGVSVRYCALPTISALSACCEAVTRRGWKLRSTAAE